MPLTQCVLKVAPTDAGCVIRVEGQGTMRQSAAARDLGARTLEGDASAAVVIDLSTCQYLDSTFLGCLVDMQRRTNKAAGASAPPGAPGPRFVIYAPAERVTKLLAPTRLDAVLKTTAERPQLAGGWVDLPAADPGSPDVIRHVMECHRRLAELGGPQQAAFAAIADNIERELKGKRQGA